MTILEKLAELGLDYCVDFGTELTIYGEGDEHEEGNDKAALDEMKLWVKEHKASHHSSDEYVDGYLVIFQDEEVYPDYL